MPQPTKYPLWDTNQTALSDPGAARELDGWNAPAGVPEKPPYQTFNHWMNNVYLWVKYINEQGVAEWDATITYAIGAYVVASDNKLYRALVSQSGNTPVGDPTNWQPVGDLINTLLSTDITRGLTAAQGKVIGDQLITATTTAQGFVEKATSAENIAGSSDVVYPSVLGIRQAFNAAGSAPVYACRSWCNFDGTGVGATRTIRGSGNITQINDLGGTGYYNAVFATAMPDANYNVVGGAGNAVVNNNNRLVAFLNYTVNGFDMRVYNAAAAVLVDVDFVNFSVFR